LASGFFFWPACRLSFVGVAGAHTHNSCGVRVSLITAPTHYGSLSEQRRLRATDRAAISACRAGQPVRPSGSLHAHGTDRAPWCGELCARRLSFVFFLSVCLCESNVNKLLRIGPDRGTWIHGLLGVVASKHVAALPGSSLQKLFWLRSMDV
jgi:hypothetical protein